MDFFYTDLTEPFACWCACRPEDDGTLIYTVDYGCMAQCSVLVCHANRGLGWICSWSDWSHMHHQLEEQWCVGSPQRGINSQLTSSLIGSHLASHLHIPVVLKCQLYVFSAQLYFVAVTSHYNPRKHDNELLCYNPWQKLWNHHM